MCRIRRDCQNFRGPYTIITLGRWRAGLKTFAGRSKSAGRTWHKTSLERRTQTALLLQNVNIRKNRVLTSKVNERKKIDKTDLSGDCERVNQGILQRPN